MMCVQGIKLGWGACTNLYTPCTWYITAELQYGRTVVHVMMAPRDSDMCTIYIWLVLKTYCTQLYDCTDV